MHCRSFGGDGFGRRQSWPGVVLLRLYCLEFADSVAALEVVAYLAEGEHMQRGQKHRSAHHERTTRYV
jgi:hypothetical protein